MKEKDLLNSNWRWSYTYFMLGGAILFSLNLEFSRYAFFLFFTGHIIMGAISYIINDRPLFVHNILFGIVDIVGIYNWFIKGML